MSITQKEGLSLGEIRRDAGLLRAVTGRRFRLMRDELAFIDALLRHPDGASTDDSVADLAKPFGDGGRWRGSVPLGLARDGLIHRVGWVASCRPSRHRGPVSLWAVRNRDALERRAMALQTMLAAFYALLTAPENKTGDTADTASPANQSPPPASTGGTFKWEK